MDAGEEEDGEEEEEDVEEEEEVDDEEDDSEGFFLPLEAAAETSAHTVRMAFRVSVFPPNPSRKRMNKAESCTSNSEFSNTQLCSAYRPWTSARTCVRKAAEPSVEDVCREPRLTRTMRCLPCSCLHKRKLSAITELSVGAAETCRRCNALATSVLVPLREVQGADK